MLDVDDFCQGGNSRHQGFMDKLRAQLKFGKWQDVYQDSAEYIGRTLRQLANFKIQASMKRYITEKLKAVTLPKERLKQKGSPLDEKETTWLRGVCWIAALGWKRRSSWCGGSMRHGNVMVIECSLGGAYLDGQ